MKEWILKLVMVFQGHPYGLTFLGLLSCGLGVPLPEEFFLVMSGYLCHLNHVPNLEGLIPMFVVTWMAVGGGDTIVFFVGRYYGDAVFETRLLKRLISSEGRTKAEQFLAKYGKKTIFAARFLPGIRMPTFLMCGVLRVPFSTFARYDGFAMLISVPIQVYLAWRYGDVLDVALHKVAQLNQTFLGVAIVVVLYIYVRVHTGGSTKRGQPRSG